MSKAETQIDSLAVKRAANAYLKYHEAMVEIEKPEIEADRKARDAAWVEYRRLEKEDEDKCAAIQLQIDAIQEILDIEERRRRPDRDHIATLRAKRDTLSHERTAIMWQFRSPPFPRFGRSFPFTNGTAAHTRKTECQNLITLADKGDGWVTVSDDLSWLFNENWDAKRKEAQAKARGESQ